jgi:hypothetical protein
MTGEANVSGSFIDSPNASAGADVDNSEEIGSWEDLEKRFESEKTPKKNGAENQNLLKSASQSVEKNIQNNTQEESTEDEKLEDQEENETEEDPIESAKKKIKEKIKYKGQEIEVDYDTLVKLAHRGSKMEASGQVANQLQTRVDQYEQLFENLQSEPTNFFDFAKAFGIDLMQIAQQKMIEDMEVKMMTPEQQELYELKKWRAEKEKIEKQREIETQKERQTRETNAIKNHVQQEVLNHFQESGIKPKPDELVRMIDFMKRSLIEKGERLPVAKAFQMAQNQVKADRAAWLQSLSPEEVSQLPPHVTKALRETSIRSLQSGNARSAPQTGANQRAPAKTNTKTTTIEDAWQSLEKRFK